jgi:hypothetical protein
MNSKIWIEVNIKFKEKLIDWKENIIFELDDAVVFKVNFQSIESNELIKYLLLNKIEYNIFRIEYKFNKKDISNAEILDLSIDDESVDSEIINEKDERCVCCGTKIPQLNKKIMVDYGKLKGKDVIATNVSNYSIIISEKVKTIISLCNDSCIEYLPIYDSKSQKTINEFYKLVLNVGIGQAVDPTIIVRKDLCKCCGLYEKNLLKSVLYFDKSTCSGADIFTSPDWFGDNLNYSCGKVIVITKKLYDLFLENGIKGFTPRPAFYV